VVWWGEGVTAAHTHCGTLGWEPGKLHVRFGVVTAVTMKNAVF
jgi:hypothetical protein